MSEPRDLLTAIVWLVLASWMAGFAEGGRWSRLATIGLVAALANLAWTLVLRR